MNQLVDQQTLRQKTYLPRLERWISSLGIDPANVASYHNQSSFVLEFGDKTPVYLDIDVDSGVLCLSIKIDGVTEGQGYDTRLNLHKLGLASHVLQNYAEHDPLAADLQFCIKDGELMLLLISHWEQTQVARLQIHTMLAFSEKLHELLAL